MRDHLTNISRNGRMASPCEEKQALRNSNISSGPSDLVTSLPQFGLIPTRSGRSAARHYAVTPKQRKPDDHRDAYLHRPAGLGRDRRGTVRAGASGAG